MLCTANELRKMLVGRQIGRLHGSKDSGMVATLMQNAYELRIRENHGLLRYSAALSHQFSIIEECLPSEDSCVICFDEPAVMVVMPCRHCYQGQRCAQQKPTECALCRGSVEEICEAKTMDTSSVFGIDLTVPQTAKVEFIVKGKTYQDQTVVPNDPSLQENMKSIIDELSITSASQLAALQPPLFWAIAERARSQKKDVDTVFSDITGVSGRKRRR